MGRMAGFLLVLAICVGLVVGQCKDEEARPVSYHGQDGPCNLESLQGNEVYQCKNFFACHHPKEEHLTPYCDASTEPIFADFPYGKSCGHTSGSYDCPAPLICNSDSKCDYVNLPNGYHCKSHLQCSSGICSSDGVCTHQEKFDNICKKDDDCLATQFCNKGECTESLASGDSCTETVLSGVSRVCQPGTACLPGENSTASYSCQPLFASRYESYCANSPYKCPYGQYCNQETEKCDYLIAYDGNNLPTSCSSSSPSACPSGFKCSCSGEITENGEGHCEKYIDTYCPSLFGKYLSCLKQKECYFDADTLINNPTKANSEFIQPLNRFSCAQECQFYYNKFVKCQNDGFEESDALTPAFVPEFSHHNDAIWKGYEIALLFVGTIVCMFVVAGAGVSICRPEPNVEDLQ